MLALAWLMCWTAVSIVWSDDPEQSVLDTERRLIYVIGLLAVLLLVRRRGTPVLARRDVAGIVAISTYALSTRLFPRGVVDSFGGNRLAEPIGYWNGLAVFAVMGVLLALGFAARGKTLAARGFAAAALPVLLTTLYFTYSRGGWMALAVGLVFFLAWTHAGSSS